MHLFPGMQILDRKVRIMMKRGQAETLSRSSGSCNTDSEPSFPNLLLERDWMEKSGRTSVAYLQSVLVGWLVLWGTSISLQSCSTALRDVLFQ